MTDTAIVPRKSDRSPVSKPPLVDAALADELLAKAQSEGVELLGLDGLLSQVTKAVLERALAEEMTEHLGYEQHHPAGRGSRNSRNGSRGKTMLTEIGGVELEVPRDRNATFSPQIVRKGQTRLDGFNDRIIAVCAWADDTRYPSASARDV
jgi:transposase-like protein